MIVVMSVMVMREAATRHYSLTAARTIGRSKRHRGFS
jgi:hypothetical protein